MLVTYVIRMKCAVCILACTLICSINRIQIVDCNTELDLNITALDDIDGDALAKLGRKLHEPLLTILGMTLKKYHPCSEWTGWSQCLALRVGYLGTKSRSRECEHDNFIDEKDKQMFIESEDQLCVGFCPTSYNVTKNGFCLKLYTEVKPQRKAKRRCQQDGGYLVNIDSDVKHEDVKEFLHGFDEHIYVDGKRKDLNSPWKFTNKTGKRYIKWCVGEPTNTSVSLCLCLDRENSRLWRDVNCVSDRSFLCEIVW